MADIVKQSETIKKATGFNVHPENINRNGRPRKGMAWREVVVDIGDEELETGATRKEYIVKKVFNEAAQGNMDAIRLLWNSLIGNKNVNEVSGKDGEPFELIIKDYRGDNPTT